MDPITGAALAGAGANLLSGYMGQRAQEEANRQNRYATQENIRHQEQFAKMGIRWKVQDAMRAGLHPLAALGAQTHSFSPTAVGSIPEDAMGSALSNMGQDVSRAMTAKATASEQELAKMQIASAKLDIEGKAIDNQIRASQLQKLNSAPPPLPSAVDAYTIPGQGNSFKVKPAEITASDPSDPAREGGAISDYRLAASSLGGLIPVPSSDMKQAIEDNMIQEIPWALRNNLLPNYGITHEGVPPGYKWNPFRQQYEKGYSGLEGVHQLHPFYWMYRGYKKWKGGR